MWVFLIIIVYLTVYVFPLRQNLILVLLVFFIPMWYIFWNFGGVWLCYVLSGFHWSHDLSHVNQYLVQAPLQFVKMR